MDLVTAHGTEIAHCQLDTLLASCDIASAHKALELHVKRFRPRAQCDVTGTSPPNFFPVTHLAMLLDCCFGAPTGTIRSGPQYHAQYECMRVLGGLGPYLAANRSQELLEKLVNEI